MLVDYLFEVTGGRLRQVVAVEMTDVTVYIGFGAQGPRQWSVR